MKTKSILFIIVVLMLAASTVAAGRQACTNEPQVGIMTMEFNNADYALQAINFMPVCSGEAVALVTSWGNYGPDETVTGQVLGSNFGAVSLQLPEAWMGTANISWMVIPTTE